LSKFSLSPAFDLRIITRYCDREGNSKIYIIKIRISVL